MPQFAAMVQAPIRDRGSGVKHKLLRMRRGCRPRHPGVKILPNRKAPANSDIEPFSPEFSIVISLFGAGRRGRRPLRANLSFMCFEEALFERQSQNAGDEIRSFTISAGSVKDKGL